jgi:hypothetical protein
MSMKRAACFCFSSIPPKVPGDFFARRHCLTVVAICPRAPCLCFFSVLSPSLAFRRYIDSDYQGDVDVANLLVAEVEPLLVAFNVSLCLWGHNHAVQRQCAIVKGECVQPSTPETGAGDDEAVVHVHAFPPAPVHMVVGTGGAAFTRNAVEGLAAFNERTFYEFGYARLDAVNGSLLTWAFVDTRHGSQVRDRMAIRQDPSAIAVDIARRDPYPVGGGGDGGDDDSYEDGGSTGGGGRFSLAWAVAAGVLALFLCGCLVAAARCQVDRRWHGGRLWARGEALATEDHASWEDRKAEGPDEGGDCESAMPALG